MSSKFIRIQNSIDTIRSIQYIKYFTAICITYINSEKTDDFTFESEDEATRFLNRLEKIMCDGDPTGGSP